MTQNSPAPTGRRTAPRPVEAASPPSIAPSPEASVSSEAPSSKEEIAKLLAEIAQRDRQIKQAEERMATQADLIASLTTSPEAPPKEKSPTTILTSSILLPPSAAPAVPPRVGRAARTFRIRKGSDLGEQKVLVVDLRNVGKPPFQLQIPLDTDPGAMYLAEFVEGRARVPQGEIADWFRQDPSRFYVQ